MRPIAVRRAAAAGLLVWCLVWGAAAAPAPAAGTNMGRGDDAAAAAHHEYVGTGPVLIPGGHITPAAGRAIISVVDATFAPMGGAVCHTATPGASPCLPVGVLGAHKFCQGLSLHVWPDWDPALDLWIWLGTPWDQPPGVTPGIHCEKTRPATVGYVYHWPNDGGA